ncbi:MAG TPA: phthalyl amidase [Micromonosporaceae bacterium]|nr:phthalyl amidase [Micromonosporaceae bacterium]
MSSVLVMAGSLLVAAPAAGAQAACAAPVPSPTQPGYTIADPNCDFGSNAPFVPLTDAAGQAISEVHTGIVNGAAYRIEVPKKWNRDLVLWAHGFRGNGLTVFVDSPSTRRFYIEQGFAWAASSYQTNGYDVGHGVTDSHDLINLFRSVRGSRAHAVYMTGASMGGHITAAAIEHFRGDFVAAMPICGVLGDKELFDFFLDANVTAAGLTATTIRFPATREEGQAYGPEYAQTVLNMLPQLGSGFNTPDVTLTDLGRTWAGAVQQRSGGVRPGFDSAMTFWNSRGFAPLTNIPFLFGVYPGLSGGTIGIADGNVTDNRHTLYQVDASPFLSRPELRLNIAALRVAPTTQASRDLTGIPRVAGDPRIPVLSMHTIGDLFVPLSMEQIYAKEAALRGQSRLFVSRAIRGNQHCGFNAAEVQRGFTDLVRWVRTGHRPAGDDILNPRAVARPEFGCQFTDGPHPEFVGPACA